MRILETLFGPSRDEVWAQLCAQIGGELVEGGWRGSKVQARVKDWILTLDTYSESSGEHSTTYTRLRAPFLNQDRFQFNIYRTRFGTPLAKLFGLQDLQIGDPLFDEAFVVQSNSEAKVRALLSNPRIRDLLLAQPSINRFTIKDYEGWLMTSGYPDGVDVLYFQVAGVIKETAVLRSLFELFAEVLNHLGHLASADQDDVDLHLRALRAPGGQIFSDKIMLWDGDPARAAAARSLGSLRARVAVPDLVRALDEREPHLRANAAWALGEIGDPAAIAALIPLLGEESPPGVPQLSAYAGAALRQLGMGTLVDALAAVLQGGGNGIATLRSHCSPELTEALRRLLESPNQFRAAYAAWALGELGAVELLPRLRERERSLRRSAAPSHLELMREAIKRLETQSRLPRPAALPSVHPEALPRPSQKPPS